MTRSKAIRVTKLTRARYEIAYLRIETIDLYEKKPGQKRWKPPIKPTYNPKEPYAHRTPY